ncbi:MAG: hypothetical protein KBG28_14630 [Kofleriaceae bacterium]|nr:hypothetical protein [Kofleriaceae bacterium]MBP9205202.1 hypothetical protein [Kofleriaceae bacterium]
MRTAGARAPVVVALVLALASCGGSGQAGDETGQVAAPKDAVRVTTEQGPVKVVVEVWPPAPNLGDPIHLRLTAEAADGVIVDLPFQEGALGRFDVTGYSRDDRRAAGKRVQQADYQLAAASSGRHRIPPLRLEMLDHRAGAGSGSGSGEAGPVEILTDEVPLVIGTVSVVKTDAEVSPARAALPVVVGATPWWVWAAAGAGALVVIGAVGWWVRGRRRRVVAAKVSAYQVALRRLLALEAAGLPDAGAVDGWFVELSGVVRQYLEGRYDIRAPELTSEEFLQVAARSPELADEHRVLLQQFMERCDRVKFAGYRPDGDESLATLRAARGFIEDTRLRQDGAGAAGPAASAEGAA